MALDSQGQSQAFESAVRLFRAGDFMQAKSLFQRAAQGPAREVAHSAGLHARMCDRRLAAAEPVLRTPDEHYDYAVALINQRRLAQAERHLHQALSHCPRGDHLYYALALCRGLGGDVEGACQHMRRAIEIQPRNRIMARNDPDFGDLLRHPALAELLRTR